MHAFVPDDFIVPTRLVRPQFILRPLLISDVVKDYEAVMTSVQHLQGVFGPGSRWPEPTLSFEQDLIDLGWHHKEFQRRSSFAHTVLSPDETTCLGCTYIYPSKRPGFTAEAYCWVRASHATLLDGVLFAAFKDWLAAAWPFERVAYPGRDTPWL